MLRHSGAALRRHNGWGFDLLMTEAEEDRRAAVDQARILQG